MARLTRHSRFFQLSLALLVWTLWLGPALATVPIATPKPDVKIGLDATMEGFFAFDANRPPDRNIDGRIFDPRHSELALSTVMVALEAETQRTQGRVALWRGWTPTVIYGGEPAGGVDWSLLQEAWGAVKVGGSLTLSGGLFASPIGLESVFARDNWCWSSSQLNLAMPFYHTGARAQWRFAGEGSASTTFEAGVYSGWTRNVASHVPSTFILRAFGERTWGSWQVLLSGAPTRPDIDMAGVGPVRGWLVDAFVVAAANDTVDVAAQVNVGAETWRRGRPDLGLSPWAAATVYGRVKLSSAWRVTARGEVFWQSDETQVVAGEVLGRLWWPTSTLGAGTLSVEWRPIHAILVRIDLRADVAADPIFDVHDGSQTELRPTASLGLAWTL